MSTRGFTRSHFRILRRLELMCELAIACRELTKICKPNIQVEDEGKYRCKICKKLFKAAPFVEKHILNKHPDVVGDRLEQVSRRCICRGMR